MRIRNRAIVIVGILACLGSFACESESDVNPGPSPTPSGNPGPNPTGVPTPPPGGTQSSSNPNFSLTVAPSPKSTTNPHPIQPISTLHVWNDWTKPCEIKPTDPATDMVCYYEIEEFDLFTSGTEYYRGQGGQGADDRLNITVNVPQSMCPFFLFRPYFYWQWQPGEGPTAVTETINDTTTPPTTSFAASGGGVGISPTTGICSTNYTSVGGPNCCTGNYTLTVNTITSTTAGNSTSVTQTAWGGSQPNCLSGPAANAKMWNNSNPSSGFPDFAYFDTVQQGGTFAYDFAFGGGNSQDFDTNLFSANYFDVPGPPGGFQTKANWPIAMQGGGTYGNTQPWYEATCIDHADDILARIRLFIRPWSADSAYVTAQQGGASNWNAQGPEASPFADHTILDMAGWEDATATNGNDYLTSFPAGGN